MNILEAAHDPKLFAPWFRDAVTWQAWLSFLAALFGLPLAGEQLEIFQRFTGRKIAPAGPVNEAWLIVGRRGGKSLISALVAVYLACFRDYSGILARGERGTVMCLAADRKQARTVLRYIRGFLEIPMLSRMVESKTTEAVHLANRVSIEVHTASFRSVRGYTMVAVIADEVAFWRDDATANPDAEIIAALRPGMATVPGAVLLGISSPYSRRGVLWNAYQKHYARDGDPILVWKADTRSMNPSVPEGVVARAYEEDEAAASAEYGAEFRRDLEAFIARDAVEAVVVPERRELPPQPDVRYEAFVDPSGGSADSMTLAIAHRDGDIAILDAVREVRPPFSPETVVTDFSDLLRRYRITAASSDRYGADWVSERFSKVGIRLKRAEKVKSDLYREFLPAINSQTVELLDHPKLVGQICSLERRTSRGGRDSIDHPPGAHDDIANVVAGVVDLLLARRRGSTWADLYGPEAQAVQRRWT